MGSSGARGLSGSAIGAVENSMIQSTMDSFMAPDQGAQGIGAQGGGTLGTSGSISVSSGAQGAGGMAQHTTLTGLSGLNLDANGNILDQNGQIAGKLTDLTNNGGVTSVNGVGLVRKSSVDKGGW